MSVLEKLTGYFLTKARCQSLVEVSQLASLKTQDLPLEFWIELTSMCPFDCVFCSRSELRGKGEHMDFTLYQNLIAQMRSPRVIRLNYSGESIHYPQLGEAISLAKATGARVELVTVLSSAKLKVIEAMVEAQLDRLTISIHALNEADYKAIYRHSSVASLQENIRLLEKYKAEKNSPYPIVDFAFVAMERNLDQLPLIAALAEEIDVGQIDIHPVIRRDEIKETFEYELIAGSLTDNFSSKIAQCLKKLQDSHPKIHFNVSNKEIEQTPCLGNLPVHYPASLPLGAKIYSCEQNPWDTVHILANGDIVTCEVRDRIVMGNLQSSDLKTIWQNEMYQSFRRQYSQGEDEKCRCCVYKLAYNSNEQLVITSYLKPSKSQHQLLSGWHLPEEGHVWSSSVKSQLIIARKSQAAVVIISGVIPAAFNEVGNSLRISAKQQSVFLENNGRTNRSFKVKLKLDAAESDIEVIGFEVKQLISPKQDSAGADSVQDGRKIGFALMEVLCR